MASPKTKLAVGLFVACGLACAVLAVIWLGMSRFLEKGQFYVTYFDESIQGLVVDSPVKYRGVFIGRVESISVAPDSELIKVILKIESGQTLDSNIVAQLKSVGITGSMFVELDRRQAGEADQSPTLSFPSEYPIVASKPSEISELLKPSEISELLNNISQALNQIKALDLREISEKIKLTLDSINQKVSEAEVKRISMKMESSLDRLDHILDEQRWDKIMTSVETTTQSLNTLLNSADRSLGRAENTISRVDGIVSEKEMVIKAAIDDFRRAMENANVLLAKGAALADGADNSLSHLMPHLLVVAQNLEKASANLNQIMETLEEQTLEEHPSQFIFGDPPVRRAVEAEGSN
jgi:phospholipid/cholesterol/gamma-HCH transport system substrate-binding protein